MVVVPFQCYECDRPIASAKAVLLHCDCCIAFCSHCALKQISLSNHTYNHSITCPKCESKPSDNANKHHPQITEASRELAVREEETALKNAFQWMGVDEYYRLRSKNKVQFSTVIDLLMSFCTMINLLMSLCAV